VRICELDSCGSE